MPSGWFTGEPAPAVGGGGSAVECAGVRSTAKLNCHLMLPVSVGARWGPDRSCHPRRAVLPSSAAEIREFLGFCPFGGWVYPYVSLFLPSYRPEIQMYLERANTNLLDLTQHKTRCFWSKRVNMDQLAAGAGAR